LSELALLAAQSAARLTMPPLSLRLPGLDRFANLSCVCRQHCPRSRRFCATRRTRTGRPRGSALSSKPALPVQRPPRRAHRHRRATKARGRAAAPPRVKAGPARSSPAVGRTTVCILSLSPMTPHQRRWQMRDAILAGARRSSRAAFLSGLSALFTASDGPGDRRSKSCGSPHITRTVARGASPGLRP